MKKRIKWIAVASAAFLYSCSENTSLQDAEEGSIVTTTISVKTPKAIGTRAVPNNVYGDGTTWAGESGYPSIGNIDLNEHPLTYTVGIYVGKEVAGEGGSTTTTWTLVDKQAQVDVANDEAYFNFRLIKGRNYKIVGYADFNNEEKADLEDISFATGLNDELDDAFFVSEDFVAQEHVSAILKRPFGKLRLIAGDFNTFAAGEKYTITDVKVEYNGQPMLATDKFNALTGNFNYKEDAEGDHSVNAKAVSYALEYDDNGKADHAAVFTQYLPANFGDEDKTGDYAPVDETLPVPQSWMYPFDVTVTYMDEKNNEFTLNRQFQFDIPVKRNWLTTVDATNFWTDNSNIKVSVDHRFDGFITSVPTEVVVNSEQELTDAISKINSAAPYTGRIVIGQDFDLNSKQVVICGFNKHNLQVTIDLNGHTITQTNDKAASAFTVSSQSPDYLSTLILEDTSKKGTGTITCSEGCSGAQTLYAMFGGKIIINGGNYFNNGDNAVVYTFDDDKEEHKTWNACEVIINGGYFQSYDAMTYHGIEYGGPSFLYYTVINVGNDNGKQGTVTVNGGSFLDYNPDWGDNVTKKSFVPEGYTVLESQVSKENTYTVKTIGNDAVWPLERTEYTGPHTLYTVVSPDNPGYYASDNNK